MLKFKFYLAAAAVVLLVLSFNTPASAFHDGGVAHCDGCHSMHFSVDGAPPELGEDDQGNPVFGIANSNLTLGSDPSSTCLSCHAGSGTYHVASADGSNFTPGGDFFWTTVTFNYTTFAPQESRAEDHGHSIIALDFPDYQTGDQTHTTSPGGNYPASDLGCSSCHDPHGFKANKQFPISGSGSYGGTPEPGTELGNYRLLADLGYQTSNVTFGDVMPVAVAPPFFGPGAGPERDDNHADYGENMSEWCATCHADFLVSINDTKHAAGNNVGLGSEFIGFYNSYASTGNAVGAVTQANAYFRLVPIERGPGAALSRTNTFGADSSSNVSCLTCHRAHATAFRDATKWDMTEEYLADSHPGTNPDNNETNSKGLPQQQMKNNSYYGEDMETKYGLYQRSLCNKCHRQD